MLASSLATQARAASSAVLTLNHWMGELWTCSCTMAPLGGVGRLTKLVEGERKANKNLLVLSNGNLFASAFESADTRVWNKKAELLTKVLAKIQPQAVNLSYGDMRLGLETLKKIAGSGKFEWVSTNLVDLKDKPLVSKFKDLTLGGQKYRIYGISQPSMNTDKAYKALDPYKALASELRSLDPKVLAVVLIDAGVDTLGDLGKSTGRDLMIVSGFAFDEGLDLIQVSDRTWSLQGGSKGRRVGKLAFDVKDGKVSNTQWTPILVSDKFDKGAPFAKELATLKKDLDI